VIGYRQVINVRLHLVAKEGRYTLTRWSVTSHVGLCLSFGVLLSYRKHRIPSAQSLTSLPLHPSYIPLFFRSGRFSPQVVSVSTLSSSRAIQFLLVRHRSGREYLYAVLLLRTANSAADRLVILSVIASSSISTSSFYVNSALPLSSPIAAQQSRSTLSIIPLTSSTFVYKHSRISLYVFNYSTEPSF
jgi:hypothetical protein